ncbi:hypothetical protein EON65_20355 [archaeon]|nr:MAG: hypothetical protein EON65_20355 [archaeon]
MGTGHSKTQSDVQLGRGLWANQPGSHNDHVAPAGDDEVPADSDDIYTNPLLTEELISRRSHHTAAIRIPSTASDYAGPIEDWLITVDVIDDRQQPNKNMSFTQRLYAFCSLFSPANLLADHELSSASDGSHSCLVPDVDVINAFLAPQPGSLLDHLRKLDVHATNNPHYSIFSNVVRYLERTGMITGDSASTIGIIRVIALMVIGVVFTAVDGFLALLNLAIKGNFYISSTETSPFIIALVNVVSFLQAVSAFYSWHSMQKRLKTHTCRLEIQEIQHALNVLYVYMILCIVMLALATIMNWAYVPQGLYADLGASSVVVILYILVFFIAGIALSAYLSACLLLVIVDVRICSVLIEALAEHISHNTITWDVYLLVRRQIKARVESAFWSNNIMTFFAYINVVSIIIYCSYIKEFVRAFFTTSLFLKAVFFALVMFFEVSKVHEKSDGLTSILLKSPLPPDLFIRIYYHHTHDPITLSLLGVRAKKFNVFFQVLTIILIPTVVVALKHIFPQFDVYV